MTRKLLSCSAVVFLAGISASTLRGTTLKATGLGTPQNAQNCVGLGTSTCPGSLELLNSDPGMLVANLASPLANGGTVYSAAFRKNPGVDGAPGGLAFYYQVVLDSSFNFGRNLPPSSSQVVNFNISQFAGQALDQIGASFSGANFGIRSAGLAAGDAQFLGSGISPNYLWLQGNRFGSMRTNGDYSPSLILPAQFSTIYVIETGSPWFQADRFGADITSASFFDPSIGGTNFASATTTVLLPAESPEPASWLLLGMGMALLAARGFAGYDARRTGRVGTSAGPRS